MHSIVADSVVEPEPVKMHRLWAVPHKLIRYLNNKKKKIKILYRYVAIVLIILVKL